MAKLKIIITGYTDTVSVYINEQFMELTSLIKDAKYICDLPDSIYRIKIIKNSGMLNAQWKKKVALNWLSTLSGIPDFTLREALLEASISSICFNVAVSGEVKIKLSLTSPGFEIIEGADKCGDVKKENEVDIIAMKRIKRFYFLPSILLAILIVGCLIFVDIFLAIKSQFPLCLIVSLLILVLSGLFVYLIKKSIQKK